jgi:hypothetical protein
LKKELTIADLLKWRNHVDMKVKNPGPEDQAFKAGIKKRVIQTLFREFSGFLSKVVIGAQY